jgi:hypothetical protein
MGAGHNENTRMGAGDVECPFNEDLECGPARQLISRRQPFNQPSMTCCCEGSPAA